MPDTRWADCGNPIGARPVGDRHVLDAEAPRLVGQARGVGARGQPHDLEALQASAVQVLHDVQGIGPDGSGRTQQDEPPAWWLGLGRHSSAFSSRSSRAAVRVSLRRLR